MMTTLSDTHLMVLSAAAARDDRLLTNTRRLPGASLQGVCEALTKRGLLALAEPETREPNVLRTLRPRAVSVPPESTPR